MSFRRSPRSATPACRPGTGALSAIVESVHRLLPCHGRPPARQGHAERGPASAACAGWSITSDTPLMMRRTAAAFRSVSASSKAHYAALSMCPFSLRNLAEKVRLERDGLADLCDRPRRPQVRRRTGQADLDRHRRGLSWPSAEQRRGRELFRPLTHVGAALTACVSQMARTAPLSRLGWTTPAAATQTRTPQQRPPLRKPPSAARPRPNRQLFNPKSRSHRTKSARNATGRRSAETAVRKTTKFLHTPLDAPPTACYTPRVFRRSSAVEQLTVNQLVVGSIPTAGANSP